MIKIKLNLIMIKMRKIHRLVNPNKLRAQPRVRSKNLKKRKTKRRRKRRIGMPLTSILRAMLSPSRPKKSSQRRLKLRSSQLTTSKLQVCPLLRLN